MSDTDHMRYDPDHLTGPALSLKYRVRCVISYLSIYDNDRMRYDADHLTGPALTLKYCVRYLISYLFIYDNDRMRYDADHFNWSRTNTEILCPISHIVSIHL